MHRVFFVQQKHPLSKWLSYIWKGSLLYKRLNNTILRHTLWQGLLCALKATFSKECDTLLTGIIFMHVCTCACMSKSTFHEAVKSCFEGMPHFWKTPMYIQITFIFYRTCYPSLKGLLSDYYLYGRNDICSLRSMEDITDFFLNAIHISGSCFKVTLHFLKEMLPSL